MESRFSQRQPAPAVIEKGHVTCPMCTHTVEVEIVRRGRRANLRPGQKCPRCHASLGARHVVPHAA